MKKKTCIVLFVIFLFVIVLLSVLYMQKKEKKPGLTDMQKQILEVASNKVVSLGYKLNELTFEYDRDNKRWLEGYGLFLVNKNGSESDEIYESLKDHNYQAIYFYPKKQLILGGSVWVLIDKDTKQVIFVQREK